MTTNDQTGRAAYWLHLVPIEAKDCCSWGQLFQVQAEPCRQQNIPGSTNCGWCCRQSQLFSRFSKNGENWVFRNCLKNDGSFPLAAFLGARSPDISSDQTATSIYYAANIPEIDIAALAYFSASIFWRGSIHGWNEDGSTPVRLGPFQESFRRYLMGEDAFPKDSTLWIVVREGKSIDRLTYAPIGERKGNFHVYKFPMPGFGFSLTVSKNIPSNHHERCFVHGRGNQYKGLVGSMALTFERWGNRWLRYGSAAGWFAYFLRTESGQVLVPQGVKQLAAAVGLLPEREWQHHDLGALFTGAVLVLETPTERC